MKIRRNVTHSLLLYITIYNTHTHTHTHSHTHTRARARTEKMKTKKKDAPICFWQSIGLRSDI